jgi:glyoxylase-like metal-dependent hydrolase (beta-lactamase superfamily II)
MTIIHHLNCGTLQPRFPRMEGVTYCLLVETDQGLALVDTGFGCLDYAHPSPLMHFFLDLMGSPRDEKETALSQIESLGHPVKDLRHIILTHLHLDHAGGLRDFPQAAVHLHRTEYEAANNPRGIIERGCDRRHWSHSPRWVFYDTVDSDWFTFGAIRIGAIGEPEIYLVPLPGHTRGHCGVTIRIDDGWLFQCGDAASPYHREVDPHDRPADHHHLDFFPGWLPRRMIGPHVPRLRALLQEHGESVQVISSHDRYAWLSARGLGEGEREV